MAKFELAQRIKELPPYLFAEIDRMRREAAARGMDLIDLGVGDPDLPTPQEIVQRAMAAVADPGNHRYPSYEGMLSFREAAASYMKKRFGVEVNAETEVVSLIGSKEGIAHLPLAFINPGDLALVPSPGYPVYGTATLFAGGESYFMPLLKQNGFLPDLEAVPQEVRNKAKLMFLNYPNNPTAAVADEAFFSEAVKFAQRHGIILCHDAAYAEVYYNEAKPASLLQIPGSKEVAVEFHSLSKTYNMTGWRLGFVCGNRQVVAALGKIKTNIDSGVFQAIQVAGAYALSADQSSAARMRQVYQERRDLLVDGLRKAGLKVDPPAATFYLWVPVPEGYTSSSFTAHLLNASGIVSTPGVGFGQAGEGYVRMSLTVATDRIKEAAERIQTCSFRMPFGPEALRVEGNPSG